MSFFRHSLCAVVVTAFVASQSPAAIMNYGTVMGDSFTFADVTEDNLVSELYYDGNLMTSGDTLIVDPDGFKVQVDGPGIDLLDSELQMMIMPKDDSASVDMIRFVEEGDFTLVGGGVVGASLSYFWQILEVDGTAIDPIGGSGQTDFSGTSLGTGQTWSLGFDVDLAGELDASGVAGDRITKVNLTFDNTLTAQAGENQIAFIAKKQTSGINITVPEPSSISLLLFSLAGFFRRKK